MGEELESTLDITADVADTDKPSQGVTRNRGDLPSKFEGDRKLFISYQPGESMSPANGIHQGCEVWSDIRVEGRMVFVRVGIIIFTAIRPIATCKIVRALGMDKVNLVKVRV